MKSVVILAILALSSCTFLRQLGSYTITPSFTQCITAATGLTEVSLTGTADLDSISDDLAAVFSKDTNTLTVDTCQVDSTNKKLMKCTGTATFSNDTITGNYTLGIKKDDGSAASDTYTINDVKTICYTKAACWTIDASTSKTPEITIEDEEKGSFSLTVGQTFETAPEVQVAGKKVTCTGDKTTKKITCTPKKDEVSKGEGLAVTIGECQLPTGISLKANSESFNKISKIVIIALAFLLF